MWLLSEEVRTLSEGSDPIPEQQKHRFDLDVLQAQCIVTPYNTIFNDTVLQLEKLRRRKNNELRAPDPHTSPCS